MAYKKLFPAQEDTEKIFLLIRRHWFTYSIFWILTFLMILPIFVIIIIWVGGLLEITPLVGNFIILGGSIYALGILALLLYGFVDYYLDIYVITDRRIVDIRQNGFFRREISELYLREVQDVNAKVLGFFPTVLHFGEVIIQTAGEIDNFIFHGVPHPYQISKTIVDLHESVVKETVEKDVHGHLSLGRKIYSEDELSKGRFGEGVNKITKEFFSEQPTKEIVTVEPPKEENNKNMKKYDDTLNKTEEFEQVSQSAGQQVSAERAPLKQNEEVEKPISKNPKKDSLPIKEEGILEEGKQIEIK